MLGSIATMIVGLLAMVIGVFDPFGSFKPRTEKQKRHDMLDAESGEEMAFEALGEKTQRVVLGGLGALLILGGAIWMIVSLAFDL